MEFTINPTEKTIKVQSSLEKQDVERLLELLNQLEGYSVVFEQQINIPSQWQPCPYDWDKYWDRWRQPYREGVPYWEYLPTTVGTCKYNKLSTNAEDYTTIQVTYCNRSER